MGLFRMPMGGGGGMPTITENGDFSLLSPRSTLSN